MKMQKKKSAVFFYWGGGGGQVGCERKIEKIVGWEGVGGGSGWGV